ncbi:MAG: hypothetical protein AB8H79_12280 [Myxococcota bacterium]
MNKQKRPLSAHRPMQAAPASGPGPQQAPPASNSEQQEQLRFGGPEGSAKLGKGTAHAKGSILGQQAKSSFASSDNRLGVGEAGFGQWQDEEGVDTVGASAKANGFLSKGKHDVGLGQDVAVQSKVGEVSAGARANKNGVSGGASATALEAGAAWGTGPNKDNKTDTSGGLSVGLGLGLEGGLNFGDKDGDGVREVGLSGGIGIVGFDFESELLGQAVNGVANSPIGRFWGGSD